jgi:hypothetical protein
MPGDLLVIRKVAGHSRPIRLLADQKCRALASDIVVLPRQCAHYHHSILRQDILPSIYLFILLSRARISCFKRSYFALHCLVHPGQPVM